MIDGRDLDQSWPASLPIQSDVLGGIRGLLTLVRH